MGLFRSVPASEQPRRGAGLGEGKENSDFLCTMAQSYPGIVLMDLALSCGPTIGGEGPPGSVLLGWAEGCEEGPGVPGWVGRWWRAATRGAES